MLKTPRSQLHRAPNPLLTRRIFLSGAAAVLESGLMVRSGAAVRSQKSAAKTDYSPVIDAIKKLLPLSLAQKDIPGASVVLIVEGKAVWAEGFGFTDRSRQVKVTADTLFHLGSISKSFTALGILRAAEQGSLALDVPIKTYLPWFTVNSRFGAATAERITLRHLLSHHSGLGTWAPLGNPTDEQYHLRTFEEVVKSTRDGWLKFPPGERFEYCNQGIDLAGYTLQTVLGRPFAQLMAEEILAPLGMTASTFNQAEATSKESAAVGHLGIRAVPIKHGIVHPLVAAGGLFSNVSDMSRFILFHLQEGAVNGQRLLAGNLLQEMYAPQFSAHGQLSGYGLGVYKAIEHDTLRFSHGGSGYGISTHYRWLPEHRLGIVLLTNQSAAHHAPVLASRIIELILKAKLGALPQNKPALLVDRPTDKSAVSLDEAALRRFEGTYLLYGNMLTRFKVERGQLWHVAGSEKFSLQPHSSTVFTGGNRRYDFLLSDTDKVRAVRIFDPHYDPSSAENCVVYLAANETQMHTRGPNKQEWSRHTGKYAGTFLGEISRARVTLKDGHIYLNDQLRLTEIEPGFFLTADGEAVIFKDSQLSVGNALYFREK